MMKRRCETMKRERLSWSNLQGPIFSCVLLFFVGALLCGESAARGTAESYPLVCRGGGGSVAGIAPERQLVFKFARGTKPAGEGLAPGECSWLDRGMREGEPDSLYQQVAEGSESLKTGGTLAPEHRWFEELRSEDNYWTFDVYNDGRGRLVVTGARAGRPGMKSLDVRSMPRLPSRVLELSKPDLYIAEVKLVDAGPGGGPRLSVRVGNKGEGSAGAVVLDLQKMRVCRDHPIPRSFRQVTVPALKPGADVWVYFDGFDRAWGNFITREGESASQLVLVVNPSHLYPDCENFTPLKEHAKSETETTNNTYSFDPRKL